MDATHAVHDQSPVHMLAEIADVVHDRGGFIIAEDERNEREILEPYDRKGWNFDAVWADDFHHEIRVSQTREQQFYYGMFHGSDFLQRAKTDPHQPPSQQHGGNERRPGHDQLDDQQAVQGAVGGVQRNGHDELVAVVEPCGSDPEGRTTRLDGLRGEIRGLGAVGLNRVAGDLFGQAWRGKECPFSCASVIRMTFPVVDRISRRPKDRTPRVVATGRRGRFTCGWVVPDGLNGTVP